MKNDLDFIRDKIENSGVKAPDDMDETFVNNTLGDVTPKPTAVEQTGRRRSGWKIALSATAAVLVVAITLGIILNSIGVFSGDPRSLTLPGGLTIRQFRTHDQVQKEISSIRKKNKTGNILDYFSGKFRSGGDYNEYIVEEDMPAENSYAAGSNDSAKGSADAGSSQSHSETYEQVEGVNEADIIKTDGKYIYCVDEQQMDKIVIYSAKGDKSERVAVIDVGEKKVATADESDFGFDYESYYGFALTVEDIYLKDGRLIVLYSNWDDSCEHTTVQVYDVSDIDHITLLDSISQSGGYDSGRMIGDMLYTVSSYTPYENRVLPICGRGDDAAIPADCIYSPPENDSESFLVISAYDTLDHTKQTESKAIIGAVDDLYCNENHMYIYTTSWENGDDNIFYSEKSQVNSRILKVDLTDGVDFTAYAEVKGYIDDQYALDEYEGNLRVATTSSVGLTDTNNLFVLDESLNEIGSVTGFAKNESIKAVRYLGDTAYVITYWQTDPLFVIDLSDPTAPAILGEAKISGFSTMLVPIGNDRMLGIGYHTENEDYAEMEVQEGLKLALFDVSDKADPKVLDSVSYAYCSSEVQYNPKALVYNPERDDFIIPLNYEHWGHYDSETMEYVYNEEYYGGVLNFKVNGDKIDEISRFKTDYDSVERCVYVGDMIYMTHYVDYELQLDWVPYK